MKKTREKKANALKKEMTFTVSEELNKLKGRNLAPKKLEKANEMLKNLKDPIPR